MCFFVSSPKKKVRDGGGNFQLCVGLRLWLWSVEILKYFLGMPPPKLPIGTNVFSKMKTLNKEVEPGAWGLGLSGQDGVIHRLRGVGLAGQLLQGPAGALIQHLQTGHIQDLGEGL